MNEFRQDPLSGDWILLSSSRSQRPNSRERFNFPVHDCPFDDPQKTGQEVPLLIYSHGQKADMPDNWTTQVILNKYPAVMPGQCGPVIEQGLYSLASGVGSHEVVITRDHDRYFSQFSDQEMEEVLK